MGAGTADAHQDRLIGQVIQDRFLVLERIAAGGMGVVYKAEQIPLGRPVALKILESKHNEAVDTHFGERFFLEAAAVAKLSHPNTIVLYDYGRTDDGLYYYAMEFVEGRTLTDRLFHGGPLAPELAIHVAMQVCGSLREAHENDLVHRDLKPGNIMLTARGGDESFVKVLDFGLVKVMGEDVGVELTKSGMLMGSPRYMAPEQVTGIQVDHRADIYSVGSVLYHALTGAPPFQHESQYEVLRAQVETRPPPLRETFELCQASEQLEAVVSSCLEKKPADRPQSMNELLGLLAECAREIGDGDLSISSSCRPIGPTTSSQEMLRVASRARKESTESIEDDALKATALEIPASSAQVAKTEAARSEGGGRWLVMLAVLVLVGAGAAGLALLLPGDEEPTTGAASPDAPDTASTGDPASPETEPPSEPTAAPAGSVRLVSQPAGASVRRGDEDLGDAPVTLTIPEGERWDVTLSLPGHEPRTVTASAGRGELNVRLRAVEPPEGDTSEAAAPPSRGRGRAGARRRGAAGASPTDDDAPEASGDGAGSTSSSGSDTNDGWDRRSPSDNRDPWAP